VFPAQHRVTTTRLAPAVAALRHRRSATSTIRRLYAERHRASATRSKAGSRVRLLIC